MSLQYKILNLQRSLPLPTKWTKNRESKFRHLAGYFPLASLDPFPTSSLHSGLGDWGRWSPHATSLGLSCLLASCWVWPPEELAGSEVRGDRGWRYFSWLQHCGSGNGCIPLEPHPSAALFHGSGSYSVRFRNTVCSPCSFGMGVSGCG